MNDLLISIIIPLYVIEDRFFHDLQKYKNLTYKNFELLIVCDRKVELPDVSPISLKLIITGKKNTGPAEKRDIAVRTAKGSICAFIDDDACPDPYWLENAIPYFEDKKIGAVGGPGITPIEDNFWQKAGGFTYESIFCSGGVRHRFYPGKKRFVKDWPAYNLLIRKKVLQEVKGWDSTFYGGEDTKICLSIINIGYKIFYAPEVVVFHHRRTLFTKHLKQIKNVAIHRGYFVKTFPETSLSLFYFLSSILTGGFFIFLIASFFSYYIFILFIVLCSIFFTLGSLSVIKRSGFLLSLLVAFGIIMTHLTYGIFFIYGLLKKNLVR